MQHVSYEELEEMLTLPEQYTPKHHPAESRNNQESYFVFEYETHFSHNYDQSGNLY